MDSIVLVLDETVVFQVEIINRLFLCITAEIKVTYFSFLNCFSRICGSIFFLRHCWLSAGACIGNRFCRQCLLSCRDTWMLHTASYNGISSGVGTFPRHRVTWSIGVPSCHPLSSIPILLGRQVRLRVGENSPTPVQPGMLRDGSVLAKLLGLVVSL